MMKKEFRTKVNKTKNVLGVVKVWATEGKLTEAKWLIKKVNNFVKGQIVAKLMPEISMCEALIKSKEDEERYNGHFDILKEKALA